MFFMLIPPKLTTSSVSPRMPLRVLRALRAVAGRPGFGRTLRGWFGDLWRDPSRNRVRRFGQACVLVAELPGEVARLYAHFIHTPAAVTRYAALERRPSEAIR